MTDHLFFIVGFCLLLAHEMDAVRCKEWKIFPVLNKMGDEAGYLAFTSLHVPIYALWLWGLYGDDDVNRGLIVGLDAFFIVHILLHLLFYNHPENRFRSTFSHALIFGAGVFGAIDLLLMLWCVVSLKPDDGTPPIIDICNANVARSVQVWPFELRAAEAQPLSSAHVLISARTTTTNITLIASWGFSNILLSPYTNPFKKSSIHIHFSRFRDNAPHHRS